MNNASLELGGTNWAEKNGNLLGYAVGDTSGRYVPREFDFSRGSNLAATRVDENGLIEKGRENLLLQSNQFDTTWAELSQGTITSGQAGYDGTNDAWLLTAGAVFSRVQQSISQSGVHTFSVYAKSGTQGGIFLRLNGGSNPRCFFDLNNGQVGNQAGDNIDASIESAGNGWYRCSLIANNTADSAQIYIADDNNGFVSSGNIYIQDAQMEAGLAATEYIESGATTGTAGILEDTPRFNYSFGASCPSLLLEPSRTNLIQSSEYFGAWGITNGSVTANDLVSPEGLINGTKFQITGASVLSQTITSVAGTATTFSVFAKSGNHSIFRLGNVSSTQRAAWFDLSTGTKLNVNGGTSTIENYGNGWYRCTASFTSSVDGIYFIALSASGGSTTPPSSGSNINIYGAMVESNASFASSYIPNHSGGTITRAAETSLVTDIDSLFGSNNTFYSEFIYYTSNTSTFLEVNQNGGAANLLQISATSSNKINYTIFANGAFVASRSTNVLLTDGKMKVALKYDGTNYKVFLNGSLVDTYAQTSIPISLNRIYCGNARGSQQFGKGISQTLLFPSALSDADCITLTTI